MSMISMLGALLLGSAALAPAAAGAQRVDPAVDSLESQAAARIAAALCNKRVVLLGELPEHGHARGFGIKARVARQLVERCGFDAVLFEVGSYDFFGLERAIAARGSTDSLDLALGRAMGGFWWTRELAGWRRWLLGEVVRGRVAVGGIDDQPGATSAFARAALPGLIAGALGPARTAECREAVTRYVGWRYTATVRYDSTERARLAECARMARDRAPAPRNVNRRTPEQVMLDDAASYFARERANADRGVPAAPDRDLVMAQHVAWWSARLPRDAKIVVWTAASHAARASGPNAVRPLGVPPLGERLAERWGDRMAAIGFTALRGQWSRAGAPSQPLAPLPADALEARSLAAQSAGDTAAWVWLDRAALRTLGPVPSRLFGKPTTTDWSAAFDGVLVIRDEAAPTFEPRR